MHFSAPNHQLSDLYIENWTRKWRAEKQREWYVCFLKLTTKYHWLLWAVSPCKFKKLFPLFFFLVTNCASWITQWGRTAVWPSRPLTSTGWCFCWCFSTQWPAPQSITDSQSGSQKCRVRILSSFSFSPLLLVQSATSCTLWLRRTHRGKRFCSSLRASQQDPAAALHSGDADEDVRLRPADLFHGPV